jgi:hypothetical protein
VLTCATREDLDEISLDRSQVVILPKDTARAGQVVYQQGFKITRRRVCEVDVSLRPYVEGIERGACTHVPRTGRRNE